MAGAASGVVCLEKFLAANGVLDWHLDGAFFSYLPWLQLPQRSVAEPTWRSIGAHKLLGFLLTLGRSVFQLLARAAASSAELFLKYFLEAT